MQQMNLDLQLYPEGIDTVLMDIMVTLGGRRLFGHPRLTTPATHDTVQCRMVMDPLIIIF
jgi:hypothetical protein